jgi:hypothetical protein
MSLQTRYFNIRNENSVVLPSEFMNSKNNRTIEVIGFRFLSLEPQDEFYFQYILYNNVSLHSNLVQKDPTDNCFVCFSSEEPISKLFPYFTDEPKINFWFIAPDGTLVEFDLLDEPHYHIELKLTY